MKAYNSFNEMFQAQSTMSDLSIFNKWGQARYAHDKNGKVGVVARFWENDDDPEEQDIYYVVYTPRAEQRAKNCDLKEAGQSLLENMVLANKNFCFGIVRKMLVDGEDILRNDDQLVGLLESLGPKYLFGYSEFEPGKLGEQKETEE